MACNDCPEPIPNPNEGCLSQINTECITYNGDDVLCVEVTKGSNLNYIIKLISEQICNLTDLLDKETFSCSKLGTCSINSLGDVIITSPTLGQVIGYDGTNFVNVDIPNSFSCGDLGSCSINDLGNVNASPSNGDVLTYSGGQWIASTPSIAPSYTSSNGITLSGSDFILGGTLLQNTTINGNSNLYDLIINNVKSFSVTSGSSPGTSQGSKAIFSFDLPANYNASNGYSAEFHTAKHYLNNYSLTDGKSIITHNTYSEYNIGASTTIDKGSVLAGTSVSSRFKTTATGVTLSRNQPLSGGYTLLRHLYNHVNIFHLESGSANISEYISFNKFVNSGIITNYNSSFQANKFTEFIQLYIGNAKGDTGEISSVNMPDSYGIWQEGIDDKNLLKGAIINSPLAGVGNRAVYSTSNGTLTNSSSDETLKTNVTGLSYGLDTIMGLRAVSYNWIDQVKYGTQREIGFVAQEVIQYVPEIVGQNTSGTLSVDYPKLTAVLTNAVQELKNKIDLLQIEIDNLKN